MAARHVPASLIAPPSRPVRRRVAAALLAGLIGLTGCSPVDEGPTPGANGTPVAGLQCDKAALRTRVAGKLTIGTGDPAPAPWFADKDPANGQGFEGAVAYAVAQRLGYSQSDVAWTKVTAGSAIAPGPKTYDFDINQFSITDERRKTVDFSAPYYLVRQAVVAVKGTKAAKATSIADLKRLRLAAQGGTNGYDAIVRLVQPATKPAVYNSGDDAKKALLNRKVDALVVDLPAAFQITAAKPKNAVLVGQLPQVGVPAQFGLVLDKDSPLTGCVSQAVDQLRRDGVLTELEGKWLVQAARAPELK